jgi:hypothetical protein
MKVIPTEDQEQAKLCTWMTRTGIIFFAIPNGGQRNLVEAVKFKRCGVQPGVPDLCIPIPSGSYHGLFLELKRTQGGKVSDAQLYWLRFLRSQGYFADVAYGAEDGIKIVSEYLALSQGIE